MRKIMSVLLILAGFLVTTCNRVPVRELSSTFKVQMQELREQGKPVKVDILWVVDDSGSMCQEQASLGNSFRSFMNVLKLAGRIDPHIAITTTNMCDKKVYIKGKWRDNPAAIRGKFVYHPATSFPAGCIINNVQECYADKDCAKDWSCKGSVSSLDMYICDNPNEKPKDQLQVVTVNPRSYCVRRCDREAQPLLCSNQFGESKTCSDLCKNGPCAVADCVASGLGTDEECAKVCSITNTCDAKCEMFFKDQAKCGQVCGAAADQCFTTCAGHYNDRREWQKGIFDKHDVECGVMCNADPGCDSLCAAQFGGRNVKCVYPGGDKQGSGCMKYPDTSVCPKNLGSKYNILDNKLSEKWFQAWKNGEWVGDPAWKDLKDEQVRDKVFEQLFKCMATVGATQYPCANQEMGLRAALQAVNTSGENADQAKAFLRDDAYLMVVIVSDEDDCSTDKILSGNDAVRCACLNDKNGCPDQPGMPCDAKNAGPLLPVTSIVNQIKSLKPDPSMVLFAAITGEPIPQSDVTPLPPADEKATLGRYYDCKCRTNGHNQSLNYICKSNQGISDFGSRYVLAAKCFNTHGVVSNICNDSGLEDALKDIVQRFSPIFARVCLPRPMDIDEELAVFRTDANGVRTRVTYVKDCLGNEDINHYTLIKYSPGCPNIDIESGDRLENAIGFCKTLDPNDNVEITYRASSIGSNKADQ